MQQQHHHPVTRLQVAGFLATALLLGGSLWTAFLFAILGSPLEACLGVAGVFLAGHLCRVGRRKWNFDAIDAAGSQRLHPSYIYDGEVDAAYLKLLQLTSEVNRLGWENLDFEEKTEVRNRLKEILEVHPILAEEILSDNMPEHLRHLARQYIPEHALAE